MDTRERDALVALVPLPIVALHLPQLVLALFDRLLRQLRPETLTDHLAHREQIAVLRNDLFPLVPHALHEVRRLPSHLSQINR